MKLRRIAALGALATATVAVPLTLAAPANADVPRCQAPVTDTVAATFSVFNPRAAFSQWENTWEHDYTVQMKPTGAFTGTGSEFNAQDPTNASTTVSETISGTYNAAAKTITFTAFQGSGGQQSYTLTNAPTNTQVTDLTNTGSVTNAETVPVSPYGVVESKVTEPQLSAPTMTDLNHGEYVSSMGGGKANAQKCVGMPLTSNKISG